jgi:hypothetical protein
MPVTPVGPLGAATGIGFQPTGGGKAAIMADLVMTANEVNPVIKALRAGGIEVTALQSHTLDEPRLFFIYFWANDDAIELAKGARSAGQDGECQELAHPARRRLLYIEGSAIDARSTAWCWQFWHDRKYVRTGYRSGTSSRCRKYRTVRCR